MKRRNGKYLGAALCGAAAVMALTGCGSEADSHKTEIEIVQY